MIFLQDLPARNRSYSSFPLTDTKSFHAKARRREENEPFHGFRVSLRDVKVCCRALSDILHTHSGVRLPVTLPFPVIFAPLMLEDHDFAKAPLLDYGGLNFD